MGKRGEKGARDKVTKRRSGKDGAERGWGQRPLARGLYLNICVGVPQSS